VDPAAEPGRVSAADTEAAIARVTRNKQSIRKTNMLLVGIVLAVCGALLVGSALYFNAANQKFADVEQKVHAVRKTQLENTAKTNMIATCELQAFNAILFDARLAFGGDKNPADYKVAALKC
jgi:signal transduction histidine kinase